MTPSKPYILRAIHEWIVDNNCTPYVLVDANCTDVEVPEQYVKDGQIVLNVSPSAVVDLLLKNDSLSFRGRFGGVPVEVYIPVVSVLGIYAKENGQGMVFERDDSLAPGEDDGPDDSPPRGRPSLKVVR